MFVGSLVMYGTLSTIRLRRLDDGARLEIDGAPIAEVSRGEVGVYPARPEAGLRPDPLDGTFPVIVCLHPEVEIDPAGEFSC